MVTERKSVKRINNAPSTLWSTDLAPWDIYATLKVFVVTKSNIETPKYSLEIGSILAGFFCQFERKAIFEYIPVVIFFVIIIGHKHSQHIYHCNAPSKKMSSNIIYYSVLPIY